MEGYSANDFTNDDSSSSGAADPGELECHAPTSRNTSFLPSLRGSVSSNEATPAFGEELSQRHRTYPISLAHANSLISRNNFQGCQTSTAQEVRGFQDPYDGAFNPVDKFESPTTDPASQWRPTYLRPQVLAVFSAVFLLMIAALELLNVLSNRNDGIATGFNKDHYLWTYGPTAFFTLIAALFNRVEYQAKVMAPWERLSKHSATARKTLLLDYVSPLQPVAIFDSLRNKDFAVAATTTVSVLMKLLIVLSSGLITLSRTGVHHAQVPMEIQNAFVDDSTPFRHENSIPYLILKGLNEGSGYPPGISDKFAFQSVRSQLPDKAQYQVMVDGLTMTLECESAEIDMTSSFSIGKYGDHSSMNLTFRSPGCDAVLQDAVGPSLVSHDQLSTVEPHGHAYEVTFGKFETVQCNGTTDDMGKRVLIMMVLEGAFVNESMPDKTDPACTYNSHCWNPKNLYGRLLKSAQILCAPKYEIVRVNVVQNGTEIQSVTPAYPPHRKASSRTLDHVSPWQFIEKYLSSFDTEANDGYNLNVSEKTVWLDSHMYALTEGQVTPETDVSSLYNPDFIQSIAMTYFHQVGAIISNRLLLQPASLNTTGSAVIWEDRLVVREWAIQWMAGLIAVCLVLSILTAFIIPQHEIMEQNPSTLSGIAALIAHSTDLLEQLRYSGDATSKALNMQLEGHEFQSEVVQHPVSGPDQPQQVFAINDVTRASTNKLPSTFQQSESPHSHPWILHPVSRLSLGLVSIVLIITVEVTLHQSSSHDGLGDVGENAYIHYTWTSIPALVFGGLAVIVSSIDFNIRSLAPYTSLSDAVTADAFKSLEFLNMSVPSAIIREAKLRNIGALATTTTLLVASFFTIFSGSLFRGVSFSSTSLILLRANNSFPSSFSFDASFGINAPLILLSNLTYPSSTYEDLAFPQLLPTTNFTPKISHGSLLSIKAVVPASRSHLECRFYDKSMIRFRIEHEACDGCFMYSPGDDLLKIAVDHEVDCSGWSDNFAYNTAFWISSNNSYFGVDSVSTTTFDPPEGCSTKLFIWGKVGPFAGSKIEHIAAMGCNQSIETVDVETNFIGADLAIDIENPPRVVPRTERNSTVSADWYFERAHLYRDVPTIPTDEFLSKTFALLTQSRWAIPLSMLGGGNDDVVASAIKFQHGIFIAQALDKIRAPATETNTTLTREQALNGENDAGRTYEATVVDKAGRQRVVQDAVSTRVLEALLLATLVLLGVGWVWLPKTNVLAKRSPTTIANAIALLAGGNLEEWVHEMDRDSSDAFGGRASTTRFWMGWGKVLDEEGILMGNENVNGVSRFGIFAVKGDHLD